MLSLLVVCFLTLHFLPFPYNVMDWTLSGPGRRGCVSVCVALPGLNTPSGIGHIQLHFIALCCVSLPLPSIHFCYWLCCIICLAVQMALCAGKAPPCWFSFYLLRGDVAGGPGLRGTPLPGIHIVACWIWLQLFRLNMLQYWKVAKKWNDKTE